MTTFKSFYFFQNHLMFSIKNHVWHDLYLCILKKGSCIITLLKYLVKLFYFFLTLLKYLVKLFYFFLTLLKYLVKSFYFFLTLLKYLVKPFYFFLTLSLFSSNRLYRASIRYSHGVDVHVFIFFATRMNLDIQYSIVIKDLNCTLIYNNAYVGLTLVKP